jgi:hypothetical protein
MRLATSLPGWWEGDLKVRVGEVWARWPGGGVCPMGLRWASWAGVEHLGKQHWTEPIFHMRHRPAVRPDGDASGSGG